MPTSVQDGPRSPTQTILAWRDLVESLKKYWFWMMLGWNDIKDHYRGSILGPFWITITTGVFVVGLGPLYAQLFSLKIADYLPPMALGITIWGFINSTIHESCNAFIASAHTIKQARQPRLVFLFRVVWKNLISLVHVSPIYLVVFAIYHVPSYDEVLLALLGFIILCLNLIWIGLAVAILCARYRDILPIVSSLMQITFFLTPIIWNHKLQPINSALIDLNPFAAFIEIVRAPLIGEAVSAPLMSLSLLCLLFGYVFSAWLFIRYRRQIVFWV